MNLHEEYFVRHGLTFPVIKRPTSKISVLYRSKTSRHGWLNLQIHFKKEEHKPCNYLFTYQVPVHNGAASSGSTWKSYAEQQKVEWDEYDLKIIEQAKKAHDQGFEPIKFGINLKLSYWEIFLYTIDERLRKLPPDIKKMIYKSIDPDIPPEKRWEIITSTNPLMVYYGKEVGDKNYCLLDSIKGQILGGEGTYCDWMVDLSIAMNDKALQEEYSILQNIA